MWQVFIAEFVGSFVYVLTWLIIRNYEITGEFQKWENLLKPILVSMIAQGSRLIVVNTSFGPLNPTIALQLLIWDAGAYNDWANE